MARTETVTIVFTDLVGSTELAGRLGHDAYEALRQEHRAQPRHLKEADWIIDLGPEGGGEVVAMGPPHRIVDAERSHTARFLRDFLNGSETRNARSRA